MEVKPGYKQTDVGVIPEDWDLSTFGAQFQIKLGKMLDAEKNRGELKPYLGNKAIRWGRIDLASLGTMRLTESDLVDYRLESGDLLVCEGGEIGRCAVWNGELEECYFQKALHRLRPKGKLGTEFAQYMLTHYASSGHFDDYVSQTSIAHLTKEKFSSLPVPVPSIPEQGAIANALSDVDALIDSIEKLIDKKKAIKQGAMQELLTGKRRLPGFGEGKGTKQTEVGLIPEDWDIVISQEAFSFQNGINADKTKYGKGIPFVNVFEIINNSHLNLKKIPGRISVTQAAKCTYEVAFGDILFNRSSETVDEAGMGSVFLGQFECVFGGFVIRARPKNGIFDSTYLGYGIRAPFLRTQLTACAQGAIRANVSQSDLKTLRIPLPALSEQTAIANVLSDMDSEIEALETKLEKSKQLKQGMMSELLTGRIRLV